MQRPCDHSSRIEKRFMMPIRDDEVVVQSARGATAARKPALAPGSARFGPGICRLDKVSLRN
jgi:hypothetical protein